METESDFPELALDDGPGPARSLAAAQSAALIDAVLAGAGFAPPPPLAGPRLPLARRPVVWVAAAVVAAAGVAALVWYVTRAPELVQPPPVVAPPAAVAPPTVVAPPTPTAQPAAAPDAEPDFQIEPAPPAKPAPIAHVAPPPAAHVAPAPPHPAPAPAPASADELLAQANGLRGQRQWKAAGQLYDRVAAGFPGTLSAHVADVAAGELWLEHLGAPARARARFQAALAAKPKGPLAEEARWGLAESYRAEGDAANEAAALHSFLTAHPSSQRRAQAEARLSALEH